MTYTRTSIWFLYIVVLLHGYITYAENNEKVINNPPLLRLHIHTLSFIKNNEYFNPIVEGHTLAGYHVHPYIKYIASQDITTSFGLFTWRNWAEPQLFSLIVPTFRLQYQQRATTFVIGNLHGGNFHRLIEPLYDIERSLINGPETGLQIYYNNQYTFLDIWLHWLTLLNKQNNTPEELVAGLSFEQVLGHISAATIRIPFQLMLYHLGGQGIVIKDFSLWVGAIGGCINLQLSENSFFKNISLNNYYITNRYVKKVVRPFKTGHAFLSQLIFYNNWFTLQGSYWNGYGFSSENLGHALYQSINITNKQVNYCDKHRHLILLHLCFQHKLTNKLKLILQINPYYDITHHLLEHEVGLYIRYSPCFSLDTPVERHN
ncbi:MAG: hypothetical protein ACYC2U_03240 [Candidatus Amoebophilus sp.]